MELLQTKANCKAFGTGLRQFIIHPKTITINTSPESYLQLLSLKHESDGFLLLQHFIFLCSPQLEGKFIDYHLQINQLSITNGESIRSFYSRAMWLFNEITLAKRQVGSITVLLEHFLHLLCSTHCHIILAETSIAWKTIREHHRQPSHINTPPPITLNAILRDIENSGVTTLHLHALICLLTPQISITFTPSHCILFRQRHS